LLNKNVVYARCFYIIFLYNCILQCIYKKNKVALDEDVPDFDYNKVPIEDFEPVNGAFTSGIQIRDLKKSYTTCWIRKSVSYIKEKHFNYLIDVKLLFFRKSMR